MVVGLLIAYIVRSVSGFLAVILCLSIWASSASIAADSISVAPLSVIAHFEARNGKLVLAFRIENLSGKPILLSEPNLPWGNRYSVVILAADRKNGEPLKRSYPIDDNFLSSPVRLLPGEPLDGQVNLMWHIEGLSEKLQTQDVILFWYYNVWGGQDKSLGEYGGWVVVPKNAQ